MRSCGRLVLAGLGLCLASPARGGELTLHGVAAGRLLEVESRTAWISGGFGRLTEGEGRDAFEALGRAEAQLGLDWAPSSTLLLRLHGTARSEPDAVAGERAGLTEAFLQYRPELRPDLALRFRAGTSSRTASGSRRGSTSSCATATSS